MKKKGFTLVEVMVTVIVICIVASLTIPSFRRAKRKAEWADAMIVLNVLEKAVKLYYMRNTGEWPPDQPPWWNWMNGTCAGMTDYFTAIGSLPAELPARACEKFTFDLYFGGPEACDPASGNTSACAIFVYRKERAPVMGWGMKKRLDTGALEISTNPGDFPG